MIKGMIFDLDGTTIYTLDDIADSFNVALKEFGFPERSKEDVRMGVGQGFRMLVNNLVPKDVNDELREKVANFYKQVYAQNYWKKTAAYDGMYETIKELQSKGIKLAVNSNKSDEFTKDLIARNFPGIEFVAVYGSREGVPHKPDPQAANEIAKLMELTPEEIAYVGDSDIDMKTGKNAGMKSVGCLWGYRDRDNLLNGGADELIERPEQLLDII